MGSKSRKKPSRARRSGPARKPVVVQATPSRADIQERWRAQLGDAAAAARAQAGGTPGTASAVTARMAGPPAQSGVVALEAAGSPPTAGCAAALAEAGPAGLAATYRWESGTSGPPYPVTIRFVGERVDVIGEPGPGDRFERVERVDGIIPGSGRVAVTARVRGINKGEWRVTATPVQEFDSRQAGADPARGGPRLPRRELTAYTRVAPMAQGPGVRQGLWPGLVGLGFVVAIVLQAVLLARARLDWATAAAISVGAGVIGFLCGKIWYLVMHRKPLRTFVQAGAYIQLFLVGAFGTVAIGLAVFGLPIGTVLDATTPGLFLGMAIGRPGCWFTGCCVGRPTTSRWGLWSSDRRLGIRRVPVQLIEAAVALVLGLATLLLVLAVQPPVPGAIFAGGVAAYTLARQVLFRFRAEPRKTTFGRRLTIAGSALVLLAAAVPVLAA